jgi:hypothetical protein
VANAITEYCYQLPDSAAHRREPSPDDYAVLYIDSPQAAASAMLLVESGLQYAQSLPTVLNATRAVTAAVLAYFNALTGTPAPHTTADVGSSRDTDSGRAGTATSSSGPGNERCPAR